MRCYAYQMTAERFSDTMWTMQQILFMSADRRLADLFDRRACQDRRRGPPHDPRPDGKVHGLCPRGGEPYAQILCAGGLGAALPRRRASAGQAKAAGAGKEESKNKKRRRSMRSTPVLFYVSSDHQAFSEGLLRSTLRMICAPAGCSWRSWTARPRPCAGRSRSGRCLRPAHRRCLPRCRGGDRLQWSS